MITCNSNFRYENRGHVIWNTLYAVELETIYILKKWTRNNVFITIKHVHVALPTTIINRNLPLHIKKGWQTTSLLQLGGYV